MEKTIRAVERILHVCDRMCALSPHSAVASWAGTVTVVTDKENAYAEPGYHAHIVCLADWNKITRYDTISRARVTVSDLPRRVGDALRRAGAEIEWADEWAQCGICGRLVRSEPDSMSWSPSYYMCDGAIDCRDCADRDRILADLHGARDERVPRWIDPSDHGYVPWHTYRSEITDALDLQDIHWVIDHKMQLWCDRAPNDSTRDDLLAHMRHVGACRAATEWVIDHESDDALTIVQDRTHPYGSDWADWLYSALAPIDTGWYRALKARVEAARA